LDLSRGEVKEELVRRLLTRHADALSVEVKGDYVAQRTHNHYVEFEARGRPSGIDVTEAAYWAVALDDGTVILAPTDKVSRLVDGAIEDGDVSFMNRGSHPTKGALIPLSRLVASDDQHSTRRHRAA